MTLKPLEPAKHGVEDTRLRILAAARKLYAERGSRGTTTREVADLAGVNEATLFRHFGTKQQLLSAMHDHFSESSTYVAVFERLALVDGLEAQLRLLGSEAIESLRRKEDLIKVSMAEDISNPEAGKCAWRAPVAGREMLSGFMRQKVEAGELTRRARDVGPHLHVAVFCLRHGVPISGVRRNSRPRRSFKPSSILSSTERVRDNGNSSSPTAGRRGRSSCRTRHHRCAGASRGPGRRIIFLVIGAIVLVIALIYGIRFLAYASTHQSTDDAQIDADQVAITSKISERVDRILVDTNQRSRRVSC